MRFKYRATNKTNDLIWISLNTFQARPPPVRPYPSSVYHVWIKRGCPYWSSSLNEILMEYLMTLPTRIQPRLWTARPSWPMATCGKVSYSIVQRKQYLYAAYIPLIKGSFSMETCVYYPIAKGYQTHIRILGLCTNLGNDECLHLTMQNRNSFYALNPVPMHQWNHFAFIFDNGSFRMSIYLKSKFT